MNRTRKIVAAGIGTAVILVVIAVMLLTPLLRTQTPVSATPPTNGAPGSGGNGGIGTGPGNGTGTGPGCSLSGSNLTWDDNATSMDTTVVQPLDGDNETNGTTGSCTATNMPQNGDSQGDLMSGDHRSSVADAHAANEIEGDLIALGQYLVAGVAAAATAMLPLVKAHAASLAGYASFVGLFTLGR